MSRYDITHRWVNSTYSKTGICEHCHQTKKTQWSNKSGEYQMVRYDWQELCCRCHKAYDSQTHMKGASHRVGAPAVIRLPEKLYDELVQRALRISDKEGTKPSLTVPQIISRLLKKFEEGIEGK